MFSGGSVGQTTADPEDFVEWPLVWDGWRAEMGEVGRVTMQTLPSCEGSGNLNNTLTDLRGGCCRRRNLASRR